MAVTTENPPKISFFDEDEAGATFKFSVPTEAQSKDLAKIPILKNALFRSHSNAKTSHPPELGTFALYNKLLAYFKNDTDTEPVEVLNLAQSRLKILTGGSPRANRDGFSVTKNGETYEFCSDNKQVVADWVTILKTVCILMNFHDEYKAIKMIGRGSFAKVYLVESKSNGKAYAVKAFTKEGVIASNKTNAKPSMINEIEIMRILDHDNIIKLYEVYETEKSIYLVLDLIKGKSLQDTLKKPTFRDEYSDVKVFNIIRSILDALAYLAAKGIMHRDLKPDNILLENDEKVKIVDFGLATFINIQDYIFKKCGTPGYIAPEVFKYDPKEAATHYNDRCDVFSAGAIFYYLVFGRPFFEGSNGSEILKANRKFAPSDSGIIETIKQSFNSPDGKIQKDALSLMLKLLDFSKTKRISAAEALNHPYFTPFPTGMTRINGSNDFMCEALSKYNQNGNYSPTKVQNIIYIPDLSKHSSETPGLGIVEKGSLFLDMGKPELNGKVDTLTSGSTNNSMWLNQRDTNYTNNNSPSVFRKNSVVDQRGKVPNRSFRGNLPGGSQSILKAAIFRNMQKNNDMPGEDHKEEPALQTKEDGRRHSEIVTYKRQSLQIKTIDPIGSAQKTGEGMFAHNDFSPTSSMDSSPINFGDSHRHPSSPMRRFQPFASKKDST